MKLKKSIWMLFTLAMIFVIETAAYSAEKTQLYCVSSLTQYEKLTYLGKNIEVEGDFVNLYANYSGLFVETVYFKLNQAHSFQVNDYISACPAKNIQVIKKYKNRYDDFIIVANTNNISFSKYNIKYNYYFPSFGMRIPFTTRVTYTGAQNMFVPSIFDVILDPVASQSVR